MLSLLAEHYVLTVSFHGLSAVLTWRESFLGSPLIKTLVLLGQGSNCMTLWNYTYMEASSPHTVTLRVKGRQMFSPELTVSYTTGLCLW